MFLRCVERALRLVPVVLQKQSHENDKCVGDAPKNIGLVLPAGGHYWLGASCGEDAQTCWRMGGCFKIRPDKVLISSRFQEQKLRLS